MSTLREIGIRLDEAHRWNANRVHHVGAPVKGEWGYDRITALEQQHAEAALRAETPPAPIRELFEQASGKRNLNYLDDLRHDLHDEEFRYQYLSACAMDGGDSLRIGIRDVLAALAQQARAETPAPREPSDDAIVGQYFEVMAERLGRGYDIHRYGKKLEWSVWKEALKRATRAAGEPEQAK